MKFNGSFQNISFPEKSFVRDFMRDFIRDFLYVTLYVTLYVVTVRMKVHVVFMVQGRHKNSRTKKLPEQPEAKTFYTAGGQ